MINSVKSLLKSNKNTTLYVLVMSRMHFRVNFSFSFSFISDWIHTLYSCLNVKELLGWSWCEIWSLSDCNWTRTHNHLVRKQTHNHLAKLASLQSSCSHLKIPQAKFPLSNCSLILSVRWIRAWELKCFCPNPNCKPYIRLLVSRNLYKQLFKNFIDVWQ